MTSSRFKLLSLVLLFSLAHWPMSVVLGGTDSPGSGETTQRPLFAADTMDELLDNPLARAVLERELPELMQNEQIEQARFR